MSMRPKKRDDWSQRRGGPRVPRDVAARPETSARPMSGVVVRGTLCVRSGHTAFLAAKNAEALFEIAKLRSP